MKSSPFSPGETGLGSINIDLQLNLLNSWTKFEVKDDYQTIFLAHLDEQNKKDSEAFIKKEIRLTLEKRSPFFQLQKLQQQRNSIIALLK